jgi:hypothetical protein
MTSQLHNTYPTFAMPRIRPYFNALARKHQHQHHSNNKHVPARITAREPVPLDPGRPSLAQLPEHVVLLILSFIQDSSPGDVRKIAALSSALYEMALYVQHHTVHIDLDQSRHARDRLNLLSHNLLLPAVRVLEVSGSRQNLQLQEEEEGNEILNLLADTFPGMTGLRDLHWHVRSKRNIPLYLRREATVPIPPSMLNHLPSQARLHTSVTCEDTLELHDQAQAREFLARLVDNQNLFSLSVQVSFFNQHECRETMRALKRVLLSCPNLASIPRLNVGYPRDRAYHGVWDGPVLGVPYCGLGLSNGERPPALEELGVVRYPWGQEPFAVNGYDCHGYPEKGIESHYWAETFDWSRLLRLNDIPDNLALKIAPKLTHLKEVIFEERGSEYWEKEKTTATFLEEIPTALELLSIPSWSNVGNKPGPITRHGAELRKLKIHEQWWTAHSLVTDKDLVDLCKGLPHLEELAIDMARDKNGNDWPYSALDIIARFSRLRTVQLWFELGDGRATPPTPHLTVSAARQLFGYLRERNKNIQRLELGSCARSFFSFVSDQPSWEMQNSISLVCEGSIRDGDVVEDFIRVTCPRFSKEMNAELGRLANGNREGRGGLPEDATRLSLKVALDGPLTRDEWTAWQELQSLHWHKAHRRQTSIFRRFVSSALKCI